MQNIFKNQGVAIKALSIFVNFTNQVLLVNWLGAEKIGATALLVSTVPLISFFSCLNMDVELVREAHGSRNASKDYVDLFFYQVTAFRTVISVVISAAMFSLLRAIGLGHELESYFLLFYVSAAWGSAMAPTWLYQSRDKIDEMQLFVLGTSCVALLCTLLFIKNNNNQIGVDLISLGVSQFLGVAFIILKWGYGVKFNIKFDYLKLIYRNGAMAISGFVATLYNSMDLIWVSFFATGEAVGKYRSAYSIAGAVGGVIAVFNQTIYPELIKAGLNGENALLECANNMEAVALKWLPSAFLITFPASFIFYKIFYPSEFSGAWIWLGLLISAKITQGVLVGIWGFSLFALKRDHAFLGCVSFAALFISVIGICIVPKNGPVAIALGYFIAEFSLFILFRKYVKNRIHNKIN